MIQIKICGITRLEDAITAQESGANAVGFIFYKESKRYVDPVTVKSITEKLNPFICKVGVFVNESTREINAIAKIAGLTNVQLHGDESIDTAKQINYPVIKALYFDNNLPENLKVWQNYNIMVDSGTRDKPGGTGKTLPWKILKELTGDLPMTLAGGLTPENIQEAVRIMRPVAVDVSSGVEKAPGLKERNLIKQFIKNVNI
jgi:phosphoribosylanthranilate isomerase